MGVYCEIGRPFPSSKLAVILVRPLTGSEYSGIAVTVAPVVYPTGTHGKMSSLVVHGHFAGCPWFPFRNFRYSFEEYTSSVMMINMFCILFCPWRTYRQ